MKPEMILQSDLLDIIFQNRNQAYGAYNLRKYYDSRLAKAVAFMFAIVLSLSMSWFIYAKSSANTRSIVAGQIIDDVVIRPFEPDIKKIEKIKPAIRQKQVAQIKNPTFKIVPDNLADKPLPANDEMLDKQIGLTDQSGVAPTANDFLPPSEGVPAGTGVSVTPIKPIIEEVTKPITNPDVMPEFPGGKEAFMKFMLRNLREPDDLDEGQRIVVMVKFIVAADGTISNTEIMQSGGKYDAEVLRVVKKMPRWKPGVQNGRFVPVYFRLPVTFQNGNG